MRLHLCCVAGNKLETSRKLASTGGCTASPAASSLPGLLQLGVEKEKVNAENAAAQVEAETCATIAREVTELQARCESELAAAEPLVAQAQEALDTLTKKDLGGWEVAACTHLLRGTL